MVRRTRGALLLLVAALMACATVPPVATALPSKISYETGPCFGACPVYKVTIDSHGQGLFEGRRFTTIEGERRFTASPAQYHAFAEQLAPLRPASGSLRLDAPPACTQMATDLPSVSVTWTASSGAEQSLYYYFGCDMEMRRAMAERLRAAPSLLPIAGFIRTES